jgi:hypothetical protein
MKVSEAKSIARAWVLDHAGSVPGLWAVLFGGSINWLPDDAELGAGSDVDIWHLVEGKVDPALRQHKFEHRGMILDVFYCGNETLSNPESALSDWAMAFHLLRPSVIHDPTGELGRVQEIVARRYAEPFWVRRRCEAIAGGVRAFFLPCLRGVPDKGDPFFFFALLVNNIEQIPPVAAIRPLTIRKGAMVFTDMMKSLQREDLGEQRLELQGSAGMSRADVEELLATCTPAYDRAVQIHRTHFYPDFDLDPAARHVMIDGARDIIERGYHREAVGWILATHAIARMALLLDAPEEYERDYAAAFAQLRAALGIDTAVALARKADMAEALLTQVMLLAESIVGQRAASVPPRPVQPEGR